MALASPHPLQIRNFTLTSPRRLTRRATRRKKMKRRAMMRRRIRPLQRGNLFVDAPAIDWRDRGLTLIPPHVPL